MLGNSRECWRSLSISTLLCVGAIILASQKVCGTDLEQYMKDTGQNNSVVLPAGIFYLTTNITWVFSDSPASAAVSITGSKPVGTAVDDVAISEAGEVLDDAYYSSLSLDTGTIIQCSMPAGSLWIAGAAAVQIKNVVIRGCSAPITVHQSGQVTITNSTLIGNRGTAMQLSDILTTSISQCLFVNNSAQTQNGGAVAWIVQSAATTSIDSKSTRLASTATAQQPPFSLGFTPNATMAALVITSSRFHGNSAYHGGSVYIQGPGLASVTQSVFTSDTVQMGGAMSVMGGASAQVMHSRFSKHTVLSASAATPSDLQGGAGIDITAACLSTMRGVTFTNNVVMSMGAGGALQWENGDGGSCPSGSVLWENCTFARNIATYGGIGGALYMKSLVLQIAFTDLLFKDNQAEYQGGAMQLDYVNTLYMTSCELRSNMGKGGGGAISATGSSLIMANSSFQSNMGSSGGALLALSGTSVVEMNQAYINNSAVKLGGAIACLSCAGMSSDGTNFLYNRASAGGAIANYRTTIASMIRNCLFLGNMAVAPAAWEAPGCSVQGGGGVGGAMCLDLVQTLVSQANKFISNTAFLGGGLFTERYCTPSKTSGMECSGLIIMFDTFINNTAAGGAGGAIHSQQTNAINVVICSINDPGMYWINQTLPWPAPPNWLPTQPCPWWTGNRAVQGAYGDVFSSGPMALFATDVKYDEQAGLHPVNLTVGPKYVLVPGYKSNTNLKLSVQVVDYYGNLVDIKFTRSAWTAAAVVYSASGAGSIGSSLLFGSSTQFDTGQATFPDLKLKSRPGSYKIIISAGAAEVSPDVELQIEVRNCSRGEIAQDGGRLCSLCEANTVSLQAGSPQCTPCKNSGVTQYCCGGVVLPREGFWQSSPLSIVMHQCPQPESCNGPIRQVLPPKFLCNLTVQTKAQGMDLASYMQMQCTEGHQGNLCMQCRMGYGRQPGGTCARCPGTASKVMTIMGLLVVTIVLIGLPARRWVAIAGNNPGLIRTASMSPSALLLDSPKMAGAAPSAEPLEAIMQVVVRHLQVWAMLAQVPTWSKVTMSLYGRAGQLASLGLQMSSLQCALQNIKSARWSVIKVLSNVLLPVALWVGALLCCALYGLFQVLRGSKTLADALGVLRLRMFILAWIIADYSYTIVTMTIVSIFSCKPLDGDDNSTGPSDGLQAVGRFWTQDYDMKCGKGAHLALQLAVGLPGIVLFSVGLPLATTLWLHKRRHILHHPAFFRCYNFMYSQYNPSRFYWDQINMLYKLATAVAISAAASLGANAQLVLALFVGMMFWHFTVTAKPYTEGFNFPQRVSELSLFSLWLVIMLEIYKLGNLDSNAQKQVISVLVIVVNISTMGYLCLAFFQQALAHVTGNIHNMLGNSHPSPKQLRAVLTKKYGRWFGTLLAVGLVQMWKIQDTLNQFTISMAKSVAAFAQRAFACFRSSSMVVPINSSCDVSVAHPSETCALLLLSSHAGETKTVTSVPLSAIEMYQCRNTGGGNTPQSTAFKSCPALPSPDKVLKVIEGAVLEHPVLSTEASIASNIDAGNMDVVSINVVRSAAAGDNLADVITSTPRALNHCTNEHIESNSETLAAQHYFDQQLRDRSIPTVAAAATIGAVNTEGNHESTTQSYTEHHAEASPEAAAVKTEGSNNSTKQASYETSGYVGYTQNDNRSCKEDETGMHGMRGTPATTEVGTVGTGVDVGDGAGLPSSRRSKFRLPPLSLK